MAFQGSLKELPLPDIIQLVSVGGKTGKFTLTRDNDRGYIFLKNGQMVHATVGDLSGEEAIYSLAIWNQGDFQFDPGEEPDRQTITKSNTNLLMEAARRLDIYVMTSASIYQGQLARNLPPIIAEFLPGLETDAQRALQFVRSTPGVGTALVGMKQPAHVEENSRVSAVPPLAWDQFKKLFSEG